MSGAKKAITALCVDGPQAGTQIAVMHPSDTIVFPVASSSPLSMSQDPMVRPAAPMGVGKAVYQVVDRWVDKTGGIQLRYAYDEARSTDGESEVVWCGYCHGSHENLNVSVECRKEALAIEEAEPFWTPEYVTGYRGFSITDLNGVFQLRGVKTVWEAKDPGPAQCLPLFPDKEGGHAAPYAACMCGYYAFKEYEDTQVWDVDGKVRMWGDIIEHERGYRSSRVELLAIKPGRAMTATMGSAHVKQIAEKMGVEYEWQM